jgi:hypothetical protein
VQRNEGEVMAQVGLGEAARLTGKNRTTIFRAMKSGRLSYSMNGSGERQVDTAELERVFPATDEDNSKQLAVLTTQLEAERRLNTTLEQTNLDLRQRLNASEAERRTAQTQLTAILTHRPAQSWWHRLFRRQRE